MIIKLYVCTSETKRVDKSNYLFSEKTFTGTLREKSSVIDPSITLEQSNFPQQLYNYMYIPEFKRYYFITNPIQLNLVLTHIEAHVDVLYTWRADMANSLAVIESSGQTGNENRYFNNGILEVESRKFVRVIPFSKSIGDVSSNILITAGSW